MLEWCSWFVVSVFFVITLNYLYRYLSFQDKLLLNKKNILLFIISILVIFFLMFVNNKWMELILKYMVFLFLFKETYNCDFSRSAIITFLIYVVFIISELLFSILFILILGINQDFFKNTILGFLLSNFAILLISIILMKFKLITRKFVNIIDWYSSKRKFNIIFLTIIGIVTTCFLLYQNYLTIKSYVSFLITSFFLFGIIIFIIGYFQEKSNNNKLTLGYDQLLNYVKTYEEEIEEKSKNQHEHKNQLILIRERLGTRNKKVRDYITELLEIEDQTEKYNWLNKLKNIPNGGLKGLIHYKIKEMLKKDVKLYIDINDNVNNRKINKYLNDNLSDVSKILGVYIDNATEAAIESKQKYIIIEAISENNYLEFSVSNTYIGKIDFLNIDKEGYSKKGTGRGYGLSLVKDIINRHNDIEQFREINGIYFVQKVRIKYKK